MSPHMGTSGQKFYKQRGVRTSVTVTFGVARTPSTVRADFRPTEVYATIRLSVTNGQNSTVTATVGGTVIGQVRNFVDVGGLLPPTATSTIDAFMTFIVDAGEAYTLTNTGAGTETIISVIEKVM